MDYMTIQQASEKWGIKSRQIQTLCKNGRIIGAVRFNKSWAIPEKALKPIDERRNQAGVDMKTVSNDTDFLSGVSQTYQQLLNDFPLKINVTDRHGVMIYANDAFFEGTLDEARQNAIGSYNILEEKELEAWGLKEHIERAFRGEHILTQNLKFPNRQLDGTKYGKDYAFVTIYNDIYSFPILDDENGLLYVVSVFIPVRRYHARDEVHKTKEYIETHWRQPFNGECVAKTINMSQSNLLRIFKQDTGFSMHEYYREVKINHLKIKLLDFNLSVEQAFIECGMDYNSYYTTIFKKLTGLTPTQYRKSKR